LDNPERTAFEEFVAFQAKISFNHYRASTARTEVLKLAEYCLAAEVDGVPLFGRLHYKLYLLIFNLDKFDIPSLTPNWYSILRDSYGLPKNTRLPQGCEVSKSWEDADLRLHADQRLQQLADFRVRPKILTPYS
jgi:hypothetical protein